MLKLKNINEKQQQYKNQGPTKITLIGKNKVAFVIVTNSLFQCNIVLRCLLPRCSETVR